MLRGSIWYPTDWKRAVLVLFIPVMVILHQSELFGFMNSQALLFGWLPAQFAWDIGRGILAIGVIYLFYRLAPDESTGETQADQPATPAPGRGGD